MPSIDFFLALVEVLSARYGWSYEDIAEKMYWEDVYALYEYASNLNVLEKNEQFRFQFMLHAGSKKAMDAWKDMPVPFPDRSIKPFAIKKETIPPKMKRMAGNSKMSPEQKQRYEHVKRRLEEHQKKREALQQTYYNWHG